VHAARGLRERALLGLVQPVLAAVVLRKQLIGAVDDQVLSARSDRVGQLADVAERGAGPLGFAGTVDKDTVAVAAGLATLSSNGFGNGPTMPMVPGTWSPEGEGEHN